MANLTINGKTFTLDVEPDTPLLWAIRENAGLTGTKYGCGIAQCGACTVHIDGVATRSCGISVSEAVGKKITTIEGLASASSLHKVQEAWIAQDEPPRLRHRHRRGRRRSRNRPRYPLRRPRRGPRRRRLARDRRLGRGQARRHRRDSHRPLRDGPGLAHWPRPARRRGTRMR